MNPSPSPVTDLALPFSSPQVCLETAGGKGANLARLSQAGFPVPPGFIVTTRAYRAFVAANQLADPIEAALPASGEESPLALETAAERIRELFHSAALPAGLAEAVRSGYADLGGGPVAVRSSATAEDLPAWSFAGQQDTYLNVLGEQALANAVVDCWASLWTARAIGYRARNAVPGAGLALAVVVQRMAQSEASGVLFTANPLSGLRSETVIDATLGLGEALVSGQVEPDHYVVDTPARRIQSIRLGAKAIAIRGLAGGGVTIERTPEPRQALTDERILALADLGQQVAHLYGGVPQDIEWAWADDRLYLLQARPITSLFPLPPGAAAGPLKLFFSFGAFQGMLDPITPLGRDVLIEAISAGSRLLGYRRDRANQTTLSIAGERLWLNITALIGNSFGRRIFSYAIGQIEPGVEQSFLALMADPRLAPDTGKASPANRLALAHFGLPAGWNLALNLLAPNPRRKWIVAQGERHLAEFRAAIASIQGDPHTRLGAQVNLLTTSLQRILPIFVPFVSGIGASMASFTLIKQMAGTIPETDWMTRQGWADLALETTRGLPNNPTTTMDLALWRIAAGLRADPQVTAFFTGRSNAELAAAYHQGSLPPALQRELAAFLEVYGGRGLAEIDLGRPRWREDPSHILGVIASYLQIEDTALAPDAVFESGEQRSAEAIRRLGEGLRRSHLGWLKAPLLHLAARRMRALMGLRETPKFFIVRLLAAFRWPLLETGADLVRAGEIDAADDLCYLTLTELLQLAAGEPVDWRARIADRRAAYGRELLRRQVPRMLLSDGRAFYDGIQAAGDPLNGLAGSPVSPGSVEGRVRIVFDPRQADLQPGEILVCRGTDPSWTPLFLAAGGLIMEVGGMMTHGAVVAREYGIPAIVGVDRATARLSTGQRVRMDGSTGLIERLDGDHPPA